METAHPCASFSLPVPLEKASLRSDSLRCPIIASHSNNFSSHAEHSRDLLARVLSAFLQPNIYVHRNIQRIHNLACGDKLAGSVCVMREAELWQGNWVDLCNFGLCMHNHKLYCDIAM